jgi:hypothetical protein
MEEESTGGEHMENVAEQANTNWAVVPGRRKSSSISCKPTFSFHKKDEAYNTVQIKLQAHMSGVVACSQNVSSVQHY